jgi:hypothetical protein
VNINAQKTKKPLQKTKESISRGLGTNKKEDLEDKVLGTEKTFRLDISDQQFLAKEDEIRAQNIKVIYSMNERNIVAVDSDKMTGFNNIFKNRIGLFGKKRVTILIDSVTESINLPRLVIFSIHDAIEQAEKGNQELSRAIFKMLLEFSFKEGENYFYYHKKWIRLQKPFSNQIRFWTIWAQFEEKWGNLNEVADIYFDAIDQLADRSDVMRLREEYYAFQTRIGMVKREIEVEDTEFPPQLLSEHSTFPEAYQRDVEYALKYEEQEIKIAPMEVKKSENVVNDIVDMLGSMTLRPVVKPETDFLTEIPSILPKTPGRKVIGVPVSARKNGSNVTVLTPVKASRKTKMELGVDQVITPVRRSLRLFHEDDYTAGSETEKVPTRERVAKLLESHGYAYVPNKVLFSNLECRI